MNSTRSSGILLPLFSLPSPYGIGDMGPSAECFIDWLVDAHQKIWQMLPFAMASDSGCPYSSISAMGGYPLLISPDKLYEDHLVTETDIEKMALHFPDHVDYPKVYQYKTTLLKKAYKNFKKSNLHKKTFDAFLRENSLWIDDFALFLVLSSKYGNNWNKWPLEFRKYNKEKLAIFFKENDDEINYHRFTQYIFFKQWDHLKTYANGRGIKLIGDIPIFVNYHSVDVWKYRHYFKLDHNGEPFVRTGAPPDAFSEIGQYWGNPNYNWHALMENQFDWWVNRLEFMLKYFDLIRLDHFRGFAATWEIPAHTTDARQGSWSYVPGFQLFETITKKFHNLPLIAEDLGKITDDVLHLRDHFKLPGMKILQFAFGKGYENHNLPHNFGSNVVVYTGTHDNQTTKAWFANLPESLEKDFSLKYTNAWNCENMNWTLIDLALKSPAFWAIIPLADVMGLGNEARINTPATVDHNWCWRFKWEQLKTEDQEHLKRLTVAHHR